MKLASYLKRFSAQERADFALKVGTTVHHLNNVAYGSRKPSASLTKQIALATGGEVSEAELRPEDAHLIWPEIVPAPSAAAA